MFLKQKLHTPLQPLPRKYGKAAQEPIQPDKSKPIDKAVVKNRVSKTVTITIIHEIVTIIKILDANGHCLDPTMLIQN